MDLSMLSFQPNDLLIIVLWLSINNPFLISNGIMSRAWWIAPSSFAISIFTSNIFRGKERKERISSWKVLNRGVSSWNFPSTPFFVVLCYLTWLGYCNKRRTSAAQQWVVGCFVCSPPITHQIDLYDIEMQITSQLGYCFVFGGWQ